MEEVVELKAHLQTPHKSQHARDMGNKFDPSNTPWSLAQPARKLLRSSWSACSAI
jgi:hypothetical protein